MTSAFGKRIRIRLSSGCACAVALLLTAGFNNFWADSLGDFTPTLPPYIFKYATSVSDNWQRQAWAGAFVLMAMVLLLNFGIRLLTGKRVVQASRAD